MTPRGSCPRGSLAAGALLVLLLALPTAARADHPGLLLPAQSAQLRAPASERIAELRVDLGDQVRAGQLLLRLEDGVERAQRERAAVLLEQAQAELDRSEKLHASGGISDDVVEAARNRVRMRQAELDLAAAELGRRSLRAPFDGLVAARNAYQGSSVMEGDALLRITATHPLRLELYLPEQYASAVREGGWVARVHLASPETTLVRTLEPRPVVVDPASLSFPLVLEIGNRDGRLIAGTSCRVELVEPVPEGASPASSAAARP